MKTVSKIILLTFFLFSCDSIIDKTQNKQLESCLDPEIVDLLNNAQKSFEDFLICNNCGNKENTEKCYLNYVISWKKTENFNKNFEAILKSNYDRDIFQSTEINEIFQHSLNMGDSIFIVSQTQEELIINELQFNYYGKLISCFSKINDPIASEYSEIKNTLDVKFAGLVDFIVYHLQKEESDNDLIKKIIMIEFYLRPIAMVELEKEDSIKEDTLVLDDDIIISPTPLSYQEIERLYVKYKTPENITFLDSIYPHLKPYFDDMDEENKALELFIEHGENPYQIKTDSSVLNEFMNDLKKFYETIYQKGRQ